MSLTLDQIVDVVEQNYKINVNTESYYPTTGIILGFVKGKINYKEKEINIYLSDIVDETDYYTTILHEIGHAVYPKLNECCIEELAKKTLTHNPEIIEYVMERFELPEYKKVY